MYAVSSNTTLASTTFDGNRTGYGGAAVFTAHSSVVAIGSGNTSFINNNTIGNGGAVFIGETSYLVWNMQPAFASITQYSGNYSNSEETSSHKTYLSSHTGFGGLYAKTPEWIDRNEKKVEIQYLWAI